MPQSLGALARLVKKRKAYTTPRSSKRSSSTNSTRKTYRQIVKDSPYANQAKARFGRFGKSVLEIHQGSCLLLCLLQLALVIVFLRRRFSAEKLVF